MPRIMSVEKSKFITDNIKIYEKNKVGQYSKFLEKNPIFVTYYHMNQTMTRNDIGTGGIEHEVGNRSPVRFNKVLNFPVFNIPEIKPDLNFDENGYDIEIDFSDILVLPNTIKPIPGDYILLEIPNTPKLLMRVNSFSYDTIQSNSFYSISCDLKYTGNDVDKLEIDKHQVVEIYQTIFDNIGTQDKCFVLEKEIENINALVNTFYDIRERYKDDFYDSKTNSFIVYTDKLNCQNQPISLYDPYLEAFINKSKIFYDENTHNTIVLTPNDLLPTKFNSIFDRSLYKAILDTDVIGLNRFQYTFNSPVIKKTSLYRMYNMAVFSSNLIISSIDIRNIDPKDRKDPMIIQLKLNELLDIWTANDDNVYFDIQFLCDLKDGIKYTGDNYYLEIISSYLLKESINISREKLYDAYFSSDKANYKFIPIILYIITQIYSSYFHGDIDINL